MQENCQSGSEGGAKPTFVPTPIATPKEPSRRVRCDSRIQRWYLAATVHYIEDHRTRTFQEEYLALRKHGAHFDEKHLWD
jgi:hypothetical protein